MKKWVVLLCVAFATAEAFAAVGSSTSSMPGIYGGNESSGAFTEVGIALTSMNNGSEFIAIGLLKDMASWFTIGARGFLPMDYAQDSNVYSAQLLGRFNLINDENVIYLEPAIAQNFFNSDAGSEPFVTYGMGFGYVRRMTTSLTLGVSVAADYSEKRIRDNTIDDIATFYNRLGFSFGYYF